VDAPGLVQGLFRPELGEGVGRRLPGLRAGQSPFYQLSRGDLSCAKGARHVDDSLELAISDRRHGMEPSSASPEAPPVPAPRQANAAAVRRYAFGAEPASLLALVAGHEPSRACDHPPPGEAVA